MRIIPPSLYCLNITRKFSFLGEERLLSSVDIREVPHPPGEVFRQVLLPGFPFPVPGGDRRGVHSSLRAQSQVVLERHHSPLGHGGKDEPDDRVRGAFPACGTAGILPECLQFVPGGVFGIPSFDGIVVVGSGIGGQFPPVVVGDMGVVPHSAAEGEKGHRHSGEPHGLHGFRDVRGDHPKVLRQEGRRRQISPDCLEKIRRGNRSPGSPFRSFVSEGNGPVGEKTPEMVDSHGVELGEGMTESSDPPGKVVLFQSVPVIERVSPELPCFAEVIRRNPRHLGRQKVLVEAEKGLPRPDVGTVVVHVDGKVPDELHSGLPAFCPQVLHLGKENVLDEPEKVGLFPEIPGCGEKGIPVPPADLLGPAVPGISVVDPLEGCEEDIVFEPVFLFPEEGFIIPVGRKTGKGEPQDMFLEYPCGGVINPVLGKGGMSREFVPEEQPPRDKIIRGYAQGVARESRR
ncbi:hypothetical protein SDC9_88192 [bioreactor metagenome]|uniref:Uncharacterized protein n=1 Tax=bioreactor metagenome TaxID=1076179 RepID=A0A644ZLE9_9ZZZZ